MQAIAIVEVHLGAREKASKGAEVDGGHCRVPAAVNSGASAPGGRGMPCLPLGSLLPTSRPLPVTAT